MGNTKEDWYFKLVTRCDNEFEDFKLHLQNNKNSYYCFESIKLNQLEFKIGNRRVLLIYHIDLNNLKVIFKTYEIVMREDEYGKFKLVEKENLTFKSDPSESYYADNTGKPISLPNDYLNRLMKQFDTI